MPAIAFWRRLLVALPLLVATIASLSLVAAAPAGAALSERGQRIHHGLKVAINQKGDPYVYGADGPSAFDCSGLTMYSFAKAGLYLPRTAASQYGYVRHIAKRNLHRGDLMFFHSGGSIYHVAIFLGRHDGHVWLLHAAHPGTVVQRDPSWTRSWYAGTLRHQG